ncbi:MAG TPA: hypothetical protein VF604_21255 [Pyrinomonadaceae bacterium]|jgi:hypothetical protein
MMNKLKYLFLLILCAGMFGGAITVSAQTGGDKVLVAGKKTLRQSDIDRLIQFYEWAFQTEFDSTRRADFQRFTEKEFRANPAESRETIDDIVKTLPQILAASESVQAETRKNFLAAFLPQARKNSDANSQMLLSIYENANGTLPTNGASNNESDDTQSGESYETVKKVKVGSVSSIVGKWVSGNTGSMTTTTSGVYVGGNASRHTYQFSADGTVEYTGIMNMMAGGCRTQIFKTAKGRANLNGSTLTINWSPAGFSYENSCSASKNYKKTLPAETETFQIHFETYSNFHLVVTS